MTKEESIGEKILSKPIEEWTKEDQEIMAQVMMGGAALERRMMR